MTNVFMGFPSQDSLCVAVIPVLVLTWPRPILRDMEQRKLSRLSTWSGEEDKAEFPAHGISQLRHLNIPEVERYLQGRKIPGKSCNNLTPWCFAKNIIQNFEPSLQKIDNNNNNNNNKESCKIANNFCERIQTERKKIDRKVLNHQPH